jgi:hypothetical protein
MVHDEMIPRQFDIALMNEFFLKSLNERFSSSPSFVQARDVVNELLDQLKR